MNTTNGKKLIDHLEQEIGWIEALNTLLSEEKIILATRQFDRLEDLAENKQNLSMKLESGARQRMELLAGSNPNDEPNVLLKAFLKQCSAEETTQINALNNTLAERLTVCRDLNTVNGQVIANNIYTRQQIVDALSGNNNETSRVYTATGNVETASGTTHHQEA